MDEVGISAAATSGGAAGETGAGLMAEQVQEGVTPSPGARNYGYPDEFMMFAFKVNPSSALWPLMGHQLTSCSSTHKVCLQSTTGGKQVLDKQKSPNGSVSDVCAVSCQCLASGQVDDCKRLDKHPRGSCPYAHPGDVARRRHPSRYQALLCPEIRAVRSHFQPWEQTVVC
jgi:hypothetical protein